MARPVRTRMSSPVARRMRPSERLTAGEESRSRSAAPSTLPSSRSASSTVSKFRSNCMTVNRSLERVHWTKSSIRSKVKSMPREKLLDQVTAVVRRAGEKLLEGYAETARPANKAEMGAAGRYLDGLVTGVLEPGLAEIRPEARWVGEEHEMAALPPGEWWAVDPVEGAVNYVHGMDQWAVTVTLVRDNVPVLAVVHQPVGDRVWTAVRGEGAHLNGKALAVSAKTGLDAAI